MCQPIFFPHFLTNGTPRESWKCQHIPQPRLYLKQWHKTKRLMVFWSKHTSRRHDITHASFFISPDRTRGTPQNAHPTLPSDKTNQVCWKVLPAHTHAPSPSFNIMSTGCGNNLHTISDVWIKFSFSFKYPLLLICNIIHYWLNS